MRQMLSRGRGRGLVPAVAAATALAVAVGVAAPAAAAPADRTSTLAVATGLAEQVAGDGVRPLAAPEQAPGLRLAPATSGGDAVPTLVRRTDADVSVIAVLQRGQSTVDFADPLPAGRHFEAAPDGGLVVVQGEDVGGVVEVPWAVDATGRRLPTHYELRADGGIRQVVDTRGATFPVVADPKYSVGFHIIPVWYFEYYWSEMWRAKLLMDKYGKPVVPVVSSLCAKVPTAPAKALCGLVAKHYFGSLRKAINSGIAHKKCMKVRFPFTSGGFFVFKAWTKKCIK